MSSISCPLLSNRLTNMFSFHDDVYTGNEIFNMKIGEEQFVLEKKNGINKVLDELCKHGWVNPSANYQDTNLYNLLSSLAETSLAERMIGFDNALKCGLPPGYNATFCFEDNGQSGVKMHYGVVHSDGDCDLFKLTGDFLFDKDCKLSHEKIFISTECFPQCPKALEDALDSRTVIKVFLDWLINLFHLNGTAFECAQSVADMENNIEVNFSKGNINQDNSADSVIESRTNGKYENDRHEFFEKISHGFDEITHYINNELDEYSDNKIEQMIIKFSDDLKNEIENDEKALKQLESDSVKPTQDPEKIEEIEERNDGFEHRSKDDFEWDDAI
ncbi:hypothetical protein [Yersinia intermedia]|uniref:Uncharacterized protein n=2 Tax=Yersinia intermedia TaxID=631 RepID=A0A0T9M3A0_YERIN|nr:hypothetical protein [Yersinia intermedia]CNF54644.1 Uncharacterised protein [Yersinia intermedia]